MAVRHVLVPGTPKQIWDVLSDPEAYASWVPGTHDTKAAQGDWPDQGAALRYLVRIGPWDLRGRTVVRISEPPSRLELEAFAGPLGSARIAIRIIEWGEEHSVVVVDEHPLRGVGAKLHTAPADALLHLRHRQMLARLAATVDERTEAQP
ncbi:SRPBCC family protein [Streptacidiphilus melanogenes]|uniref:SRPBCC family protein n=1 Tax=Streptacidiphilus melanogenes TaxID=411235 RepID=UPI0005A5ED09|nr:SRPBCC family protein [Streptacidiphilus melanogenes]